MRKALPPLLLAAVFAAAANLAVSPAQAALIAEQAYDGATFGFNSPFTDGSSVPGLAYSTLTVSGTAQDLGIFGQSSSFSGGELTNNGTYYVSWLNQISTTDAFRTLSFIASDFKDGNGAEAPTPKNGGGTGTNVVEIGQGTNGLVSIGAGNYGTVNGIPGGVANNFELYSSVIAAGTGTNMFLVKVEQTPPSGTYLSVISLWFNPAFSDEASLGAPLLSFATQSFHLEQIRLFSNEIWDEIRVGQTLADVTPGLPIPEPSSVALIGLGLGFGLFFRKRAVAA